MTSNKYHFLSVVLTHSAIFMATLLFSAVFFSATALFTEFTSSSYADSGSGSNSNSTLSVRIAKDYQDGNGLVDITTLKLDLSPNANGVFVKDDLDVIVTTTNETGYTLNIADNDTDTALHHTAPNSTATIPTLPSGTTPTAYTEATFPVNTWGYSTEPITVSSTGTSTNNLN